MTQANALILTSENTILVAIVSFLLGIFSCYIALVIGKRKNETLNEEDISINVAKYPLDDEMKMTLVIRTDLQMGKGKVAAQCSHATLAAYQKALKQSSKTREWIKVWEEVGTAKITLKCNDETEMLQLQKDARSLGLIACSIQDAGRTQIAAGSRTVLAIGPGPKSLIDKVSGHLKLY